MDPDQTENKNQKILASFVVIFAVVIIGAGTTVFANKKKTTGTSISTPAASTATSPQTTSMQQNSSMTPATSPGMMASTYKDGTYSATGVYESPGGQESITVNLTVKGDTITDSSIQQDANNRDSAEYQAQFKSDYQQFVVGKALKSLSLSNVSGSSLTSEGFNVALEKIKSKAQS